MRVDYKTSPTTFLAVAVNPEINNPETFGSVELLTKVDFKQSGSYIIAEVALPVGATVTDMYVAISGAAIGAIVPVIDIESVPAGTTFNPATPGNVITNLTLTKFANNVKETIDLSAATLNYTLLRNNARGTKIYISSLYTLAPNSVYSLFVKYFVPISGV